MDNKPAAHASSPRWHAGALSELATAYWHSAVLLAAVELGVFDAIGEGAALSDIAQRTGTSERHVGELLDALCGLELLVKAGDTYRIEASAAPLLRSDAPGNMAGAMRYNADLYPLWGRLGDGIRSGEPVRPADTHLGADEARTRRFVMGMHSRAEALAPAVIPALPVPSSGRVLDIGSGPGTFTRHLAEQCPGIEVTQFDLPPVLAVARELTDASPAAARIAFVDGDYRKDPLPQGFDLVLYCGALHQEDPESAHALFSKAAAALVPGGTLAVVDLMLEPSRSQPLFSVLFSLNMMLTSPRGRVFTGEEVLKAFDDLGLEGGTCSAIARTPYWMVTAQNTHARLQGS